MTKYEYAAVIHDYKTNWAEIQKLATVGRPEQTWEHVLTVYLPGAQGVVDSERLLLPCLNRLGEDGWFLVTTTITNSVVVPQLYGWSNVSEVVSTKYILRREKP